jgi:hypothetical protein
LALASENHDLGLLEKSLKTLTRRADFPLAFGGLATSAGAPLTSFVGTRGQSLNGLLIEPMQGLGGRALAERRPVSATHYSRAATITHRYDREVLAEDIVSLLAVPVIVDGTVRAVLYGGHRVVTQFSDSVIGQSIKIAQGLAWEYSVHDEVERRIALIETEGTLTPRHERTPDVARNCESSSRSSERSRGTSSTRDLPDASMRWAGPWGAPMADPPIRTTCCRRARST